MARIHRVLPALLVVGTLVAVLTGQGPAFTMYASTVWFKVDVVAEDGLGRHAIAPTDLARRVTPSAVPYLAGSDHYRRTYDVGPLRRHLGDLARIACDVEAERPLGVSVVLSERTRGRDAPRETRAHVSCAR